MLNPRYGFAVRVGGATLRGQVFMLNPRDGFAVRVPFCLMHWLCNVFYVVCMCRCAALWSYVRLSLSIPSVCYLEKYLLSLNDKSICVLLYY